MALSEKQTEDFRAFLEKKVYRWGCPLCRQPNWTVRSVARVKLGDDDFGDYPEGTLEFAVMICNNCGNSLFIHLGKPGAEIVRG